MRAAKLIIAVIALGTALPAAAEPFAQLRAAYAARDAEAAAAAYTSNAEVIYRYDGAPEERHVGRDAIAASFRALFTQIDPDDALDLNFRTVARDADSSSGVYRLRIGQDTVSYGRFAVTLAPDGKFASDLSTGATADDFEEAPGPLMVAADETLDRGYYGRLTGRYSLPDGCALVVTRSLVRLFIRNTCTNAWRGLSRRSGREWTAGDRVLSDTARTTYRFAPFAGNRSPAVEIDDGRFPRVAARVATYRTQDVTFAAADGVTLSGVLYLPAGPAARRPASVMLHGSGPQDRDGYASIIAVMADQLAAAGRVVLAFDKRGSGASGGDGARAGFDQLAADADAAMAYLAGRAEVDRAQIGLAGSSQAGWVAARALARGSTPADVLLLGAAGAAMTVAEQNLYNTGVRMRCEAIAENKVQLALDQQAAFFAFLRDPGRAPELDALTAQGIAHPELADWLFPASTRIDRTAGEWYVVLDPAFDPLPIWRAYKGRTLFLFGDNDDSTPTVLAAQRLAGSGVRVRTLAGVQHLGLLAADRCRADLSDVDAFSPAVMDALSAFGASSGDALR